MVTASHGRVNKIVNLVQRANGLLFHPGLLSLLPDLPLLLHLHLPRVRVFLAGGLMLCPQILLQTFLATIGLCPAFAAPGDNRDNC